MVPWDEGEDVPNRRVSRGVNRLSHFYPKEKDCIEEVEMEGYVFGYTKEEAERERNSIEYRILKWYACTSWLIGILGLIIVLLLGR